MLRRVDFCFVYALASAFIFFFSAPAPPEIYTLSLHDALPTSSWPTSRRATSTAERAARSCRSCVPPFVSSARRDRKSTRLNSSHSQISYAVFCLKKKTTLRQRIV